jgi:HEAT repeat protein
MNKLDARYKMQVERSEDPAKRGYKIQGRVDFESRAPYRVPLSVSSSDSQNCAKVCHAHDLLCLLFWCLVSVMISGCAKPVASPIPTFGSGPQSQNQTIQLLITRLKNADAGVRVNAAEELGRSGVAEAVPALSDAMNDDYWGVRLSAAMALGDIGNASEPAVPTLAKALRDETPSVRSGAAWALGRIGEPAKAAIPALIEALQEDEASIRFNAAYALGRIGEAAKDAVPALIQALRDEDGQVRHFATEALKQIGTSEATEAGTQ